MRRRVPDTAKIRALTGWQPRRSLDTVLAEAIAEARDEMRDEGIERVIDLMQSDALLGTRR